MYSFTNIFDSNLEDNDAYDEYLRTYDVISLWDFMIAIQLCYLFRLPVGESVEFLIIIQYWFAFTTGVIKIYVSNTEIYS